MRLVEVLVMQPMTDAALAHIVHLDAHLHVVDARGWFDDEIRQTWPQWTVQRYLGNRPCPPSTRAERDRLLARAEVILGGGPFCWISGRERRACVGFINNRQERATCAGGICGAVR